MKMELDYNESLAEIAPALRGQMDAGGDIKFWFHNLQLRWRGREAHLSEKHHVNTLKKGNA